MRQYSCARSSCRTMPTSSASSICTSTMGRSPEIPCAQSAAGPSTCRASTSEGARSERSEYRIDAAESSGTGALRRARCRGGAAAPAPGSRRVWQRARRSSRRDTCRRVATRRSATKRRASRKRRGPSFPGGHAPGGAGSQSGRAPSLSCWTARWPPSPLAARVSHAPAEERARSVSHSRSPIGSPSTASTWASQTGASSLRPRTARREQGVPLRDAFGLDEQIGERGMHGVRCGGRQDDLRVRGHLDLARPRPMIRDRHAADFRVVLRRHDHLEPGRDRAVAADELGTVLGERDFIGLRFGAARLETGRPALAAGDVAEKNVRPVVVAGRVLAPARDRPGLRQRLYPEPAAVIITA